MLIDSDVLIWVTRGHPGAAARLKQIAIWRISAVPLLTANIKHFSSVEGLGVERFDPARDAG